LISAMSRDFWLRAFLLSLPVSCSISASSALIRAAASARTLSEKNKAPVEKVEEKKEEKVEEKVEVKKEKKKDDKKAKKEESGGISPEERKELEKIKEDIIAKKKELKEQSMTGGQMNKEPTIVAWVKRMTELKEKAGEVVDAKAEKKAEKKKGKDPEALENLKKEIEAYKEKLKTEFGYTKADINKDEDIMAMTKKLKEMKG